MRNGRATFGWISIGVMSLALAACGGGDKPDKHVATAEPKRAAAAAPKPSSPPPAADPPPAAEQPSPEAAADPSHHAGHHKEKGEHAGKGPHGPEAERGAKAGEHDKSQKVIHLGHARMEFNHPGNGWTERKKGPWTLFAPTDKSSVLGFVEFENPGEATSRIGQIAGQLELTDINWRGSGEDRAIGPQHLRAHYAEGTCRVATNHHTCEIEYYTVEGALLIVYAFETDVKKVEKKERLATRSVETLRRF
jgi:hypothetical protein